MATNDLEGKETSDVTVDSAAVRTDGANAVVQQATAGRAARLMNELIQGVIELDRWVALGHTPLCFDLGNELAALADVFVAGGVIIPDQLKDAASRIKGCAICTEVLEGVVKEDLSGELPQAWRDLKPANEGGGEATAMSAEEAAALPPK